VKKSAKGSIFRDSASNRHAGQQIFNAQPEQSTARRTSSAVTPIAPYRPSSQGARGRPQAQAISSRWIRERPRVWKMCTKLRIGLFQCRQRRRPRAPAIRDRRRRSSSSARLGKIFSEPEEERPRRPDPAARSVVGLGSQVFETQRSQGARLDGVVIRRRGSGHESCNDFDSCSRATLCS